MKILSAIGMMAIVVGCGYVSHYCAVMHDTVFEPGSWRIEPLWWQYASYVFGLIATGFGVLSAGIVLCDGENPSKPERKSE